MEGTVEDYFRMFKTKNASGVNDGIEGLPFGITKNIRMDRKISELQVKESGASLGGEATCYLHIPMTDETGRKYVEKIKAFTVYPKSGKREDTNALYEFSKMDDTNRLFWITKIKGLFGTISYRVQEA